MKHSTRIILTSAALLASAQISNGAGFQVQEQGASNMGTAMAGAVANANDDASAAFVNPSAIAFREMEDGRILFNAAISAIIPTLTFVDAQDGYQASCAQNAYVPNFFGAYKFNDSLYVTLSSTAPFGLESQYADDWRYADQGTRSFLMTLDLNPSIVWKITDWFSISGGLSAQYAYCSLSQAVGPGMTLKMKGDSFSVGGNIGFTVKYADEGRFAFSWRSAVDHTLSGNAYLNGNKMRRITADVTMPDTFTFGVYQRLPGDFHEFALMADYSYIRWSTFEELAVSGFPAVKEDWKDTSRVSIGAHYYPDFIEDLTLRAGVAYDESPVQSAEYRTVRIPCSDRIWFSTGLGYKMGDVSFDLAYTFIMVTGSQAINRVEASTATGHYYSHIHVISAQIGFEF